MRPCPLKHKECPLKRQLVGRVVRSLEIQVAKATSRQKNGSAEESIYTGCVSTNAAIFRKINKELKLLCCMHFTDVQAIAERTVQVSYFHSFIYLKNLLYIANTAFTP